MYTKNHLYMKKVLLVFLFGVSLFSLNSCAKPIVTKVIMDGDEQLNCKQLKRSISETEKIKKDAEFAKEATGGNITRVILFWPAWAQTLHNADTAIQAANDRNYHLINLMRGKKCKDVDYIRSQVNKKLNQKNNITEQLKILKTMFDSGDLTQEEYTKAKKRVLE